MNDATAEPAELGTPTRTLRVGCPMWAHPPWLGRFLSPQHRGRELTEYARWCNAVEGNTTFYAEPSASTIERWAELAPSDFRFAFKLPRTITHEQRLVRTDALLASFLHRIGPLGARIGPLQIQLPPSLAPSSIRAVTEFVERLPGEYVWAIEFRHAGWFQGLAADRIDEVLAEHGVGRVVLDTRPLYADPPRSDASLDERRTKPKLPIRTSVPGAMPIVRVIGADAAPTTLDGLTAWTADVVAWLDDGREPYVFVHQPENLDSPALARHLHAHVASSLERESPVDRQWRLADLPEPLPVAPRTEVAGQDSLF